MRMSRLKIYTLGFVIILALAVTAGAQTAPPVLATIGSQSVDEGQNLNFNISVTDIDGTIAELTTSAGKASSAE